MSRILLETLESTELKAKCDESCKILLSNKEVIARILQTVVDELSAYDTDFIRDYCIEGDVIVSKDYIQNKNIDRSYKTCDVITGLGNESVILGEGIFTFDIIFHVIFPREKECVKMIINMEAQNKYNPGYFIETRGVYYTSHMISSQYGKEFTGSDYSKIKKVYSIWIGMNPSKKDVYTIRTISLCSKNKIGNPLDIKQAYDLINITKICLGGEVSEKYENYSGIIKMLDIIFSNRLSAQVKMKVLSDEYSIQVSEIEEDMSDMCNFSEYYYETGRSRGYTEGMKMGLRDGEIKGKKRGLEEGIAAFVDVCREFNISNEDIILKIVNKFLISKEDAENFVSCQ